MTPLSERYLKTGGDPRAFADYSALREELGKLAHPARPDVDWKKVEQLCLSLFQQNGIELQTASWYTQARVQRAGLAGLNEGLAILDALISYQWPNLWPQPAHARMEILTGLSQRLQQSLRTMTLTYCDLPAIYQAEQLINTLCDVLQRLELKHASQLVALSTFMHSAAIRLENLHAPTDSAVVLSTIVDKPERERATESHKPWVYIGQSEAVEPQVITATETSSKRHVQWKGFTAGVVVTVLIGGGINAGVNAFYHPPSAESLMETLPLLSKPLNTQALAALKNQQSDMLSKQASKVISATQQRTSQLATLSPRWAQETGTQLVTQALVLWPDNPATATLAKKWSQQLNANAAPLENLNGWYSANMQLQQLADKLNGLDEQRGKYMTVSQLKSSVFAIQQALNRSQPVEESLRKLAEMKQQEKELPPQLLMQLDNQFTQLLNRYALLVPVSELSPP